MKRIVSIIFLTSYSLFSMHYNSLEETLRNRDLIHERACGNVPDDDVVYPGGWSDRDNPLPYPFIKNDLEIRGRYIYTPRGDNVVQDPISLWVVIHGTWGNGSKTYFDNSNPHFKYIKRAAAWYAVSSQKKLELLPIKWSGILEDESRRRAGNQLIAYLFHYNEYKNADISLLTHSHGGNIANYISQLPHFKDKHLENLIYFACPRRSELHYQPEHFKQLIYFYADDDIVAKAARIPGPHVRRTVERKAAKIVVTQIVASVAKGAVKVFLPRVYGEPAAKGVEATANLLSLCECVDGTRQIIGTIHKDDVFPLKDGKLIAGIHTSFNNKGAGHLEIIKAVEFLPQILKTLHNDYINHFVNGSLFDLYITQDGADNEAVLTLSDKNHERAAEPPRSFNLFQAIPSAPDQQLPYIYATRARRLTRDEIDNLGALDALTRERALSEQELIKLKVARDDTISVKD